MNQRIKITDLRDPRLDIYARLSEVQLLRYAEPAPGIFIGESPKVIRRALVAGYKPISFLVADSDLDREALEILEQWQGIPVYTAEEAVLRKLTGFAMTRGMLCGMQRKALPAVEDICRDARRIAILENVVIYQQPDFKPCGFTCFQSHTVLGGFYQGLCPLYSCRTHLCITSYVIDVQDPGNALDALMFVLAIDAEKCSRN